MKKIFLILVFITVFGLSNSFAGDIDKEAVQGAMTNYIEVKTASGGGVYDINGVVAELDYLHSGVKEKDGLFVSCADFKANGDVYDIDYYVSAKDGEYTVIKEVFHKKNGKKVNEDLWDGDAKDDGKDDDEE